MSTVRVHPARQGLRPEVMKLEFPSTQATSTSTVTFRLPEPLSLASLRKQCGMTVKQVADLMRVSPRTVRRIEADPDPRVSTLGRYMAALGFVTSYCFESLAH